MSKETTDTRGELRRARLKLVALFAVFFVPVVVALLMNVSGGWRLGATTNHGTLVNPAVQLSAAGLRTSRSEPADAALFQVRWTLMLVGASPLEERTHDALYVIRQAREALGKDRDRVQRMMVVTEARGAAALTATDSGLNLVVANRDWLATVKAAIGARRESRAQFADAGYICLVDPQGYLMMYYPAPVGEQPRIAEAKGILKDLKRLLKISKIG